MSKAFSQRGYLSCSISLPRRVSLPFRRSTKDESLIAKESVTTPVTDAESEVGVKFPTEPETEPEVDAQSHKVDVTDQHQPSRAGIGLCSTMTCRDDLQRDDLQHKALACAADDPAGSGECWQDEPVAEPAAPSIVQTVGEEAALGLGVVLESMARLTPHSNARTVFHATRPCPIAIGDYMNRLRQYFQCSMECYVVALVYIDRAIKREPRLVPDARSVHRLALCGLLLAAKFQDDTFYSNKFYAQVGGVTVKEINGLELVMLRVLDYRLFIEPEEFVVYHKMVEQASKAAKGVR